jgi:hypothetical protein
LIFSLLLLLLLLLLIHKFYIAESWLTTLVLDVENLIENGEDAPIEEELLECRLTVEAHA